jgi:hypothetical protein
VSDALWLSIWVASGLCLGERGGRLVRQRARRPALRACQRGTASLEFVLVFPVYLLLIALFVESSLVMLAKCGTTYAAYAAARSAGAWYAAAPGHAPRAARQAAVLALSPFSSADPAHHSGGVSPQAARLAADLQDAWPYPPGLIAARASYAEAATAVETWREGGGARAVVRFQYPMHVALLGRAIGHRAAWAPHPWVYEVRSEARVPTALPVSSLGIHYVPRH